MAKSTLAPPTKRIIKILSTLEKIYPDAACSLNFSNALELLVATILSAQCTDKLVNQVTIDLFKRYNSAKDYAHATLETLEQDIRSVNFYRNKAKSIHGACSLIVEKFNGKIPNKMADLIQLPGVARKTANVVLGNAFNIQSGVVVDTHVMRLSQRLALSSHANRDKIEQDLIRLVPRSLWTHFGHQMILHGRNICKAKNPKCGECQIGRNLCPAFQA